MISHKTSCYSESASNNNQPSQQTHGCPTSSVSALPLQILMRQELLGSHFICVLYSITNTFQKYSITKGHYSNSSNLHFLKTVIYILTSTHSPCVSIFPSTAKTSLQPSCVSISILKTSPSIFAQVCKNQPSFAEHRTSPYLQVEGR